jgi:hypothetical protein
MQRVWSILLIVQWLLSRPQTLRIELSLFQVNHPRHAQWPLLAQVSAHMTLQDFTGENSRFVPRLHNGPQVKRADQAAVLLLNSFTMFLRSPTKA